jgi:thiol-disulfide isomerase/thioredoxin
MYIQMYIHMFAFWLGFCDMLSRNKYSKGVMRIESKSTRSKKRSENKRYALDESRPFISRLGRRIITLSASLLVTILLMVMPQLEAVEQELITLLVILPIAFMGVYRLLQMVIHRDPTSETADVPLEDLVKATVQEVYREWDEAMGRDGTEDDADNPNESNEMNADNASPVDAQRASIRHMEQLDNQ